MTHEKGNGVQRVDNIADKEAFDAPIDRYYRGTGIHRCRDVGVYDIDRMVAANPEALARSTKEYLVSASGLKRKLFWTNVLFDFGNGLFWHATVKTGMSYNSNGNSGFESTYTVIVVAPTPEQAQQEIEKVLKLYSGSSTIEGPSFQMLRELRGAPITVPVDNKYHLAVDELNLHYGSGFRQWSEKFVASLGESGLSILQGEPGTGKTSYLRHLICDLSDTHRFYYVPVESFGILSSSSMPGIWAQEERKYPQAIKVIILEDAERLLVDRRGANDALTSSLLNLTDGFIGDLINVHLVCTMNCSIEEMDKALMRPGRQKFYREFGKIDYEHARVLAESLGFSLPEQRDYTLAEIYHYKDLERSGENRISSKKSQIGFNTD